MLRILEETRLSLTELAQEQDISVPTAWRWYTNGIRGQKLETIQIGGRRYTSKEAFERFVEATTAAESHPAAPLSRTSRQKERDIKDSDKYLDSQSF